MTLSYELALALKEAGWPQPDVLAYRDSPGKWNYQPSSGYAYFPSLDELIEACPHFIDLRSSATGWMCKTLTGLDSFRGATPSEAAARLWLALKKEEII